MKKGSEPLKGAALARLALEKSGISPKSDFYRELLEDLSLKDEDVMRYIDEHGQELQEILEHRLKTETKE